MLCNLFQQNRLMCELVITIWIYLAGLSWFIFYCIFCRRHLRRCRHRKLFTFLSSSQELLLSCFSGEWRSAWASCYHYDEINATKQFFQIQPRGGGELIPHMFICTQNLTGILWTPTKKYPWKFMCDTGNPDRAL